MRIPLKLIIDTEYPIIDILPTQKALLAEHAYGGTMRLGAYSAMVKKKAKWGNCIKHAQ